MNPNCLSQKFKFFTGLGNHIFYSRKGGELFGVGQNDRGQLCLGHTDSTDSFEIVEYFPPKTKREVCEVACGRYHSVFLLKGGEVWSCGCNGGGGAQGGLGHRNFQKEHCTLASPVVLDTRERVKEVFSGVYSTYVLTKSGNVFGCGSHVGKCPHCVFTQSYRIPTTTQRVDAVDEKTCNSGRVGKIYNLKNIIHIFINESSGSGEWAMFLSRERRVFYIHHGVVFCPFFDKNRPIDPYMTQPLELTFFKERGIRPSRIITNQSTAFFVTEKKQVYQLGRLLKVVGAIDGDPVKNEPVLMKEACNFDVISSGLGDMGILWTKNEKLYGRGFHDYEDTYIVMIGLPVECNRDTGEVEYMKNKKIQQIITTCNNYYAICQGGLLYSLGYNTHGTLLLESQHEIRFNYVGKGYDFAERRWYDESVEKMERLQYLCGKISIFNLLISKCYQCYPC